MTVRVLIGDAIEQMRTLPDDSVDLVLSSPPFLALRSYLPPRHPDKAKEMGSESTPGEFLDALLDVVEECARVLAPHGSLCIELGDTYAGSGGAGGDYGTLDPGHAGLRGGQPKFDGSALASRRTRNANRPSGERTRVDGNGKVYRGGERQADHHGWPLDKSLCLVPELFRFALVYGVNPLTGRETERWRVRNVVRWVRPNPPVGALGDKFRPATSELVVACKSRRRYFDLDAVRRPGSPNTHARTARGVEAVPRSGKSAERGGNWRTLPELHSSDGAPPLDWWAIPTAPYAGAHYAAYPPGLCVRPIKAMCPPQVCTVCGEPRRRIKEQHKSTTTTTTGWTDCGHDLYRRGVVLDPFAGSGTTGQVADGHGRDAVLIDLDPRNLALIEERIGTMFLQGLSAVQT